MLIFNPHNDLEMINSILQISKLRCRRMDQKFEARPLCLYVHVLFQMPCHCVSGELQVLSDIAGHKVGKMIPEGALVVANCKVICGLRAGAGEKTCICLAEMCCGGGPWR